MSNAIFICKTELLHSCKLDQEGSHRMCGISGIVHKNASLENPAPIGRDLKVMLEALAHRGRDSTGITIAGNTSNSNLIVRLWGQDKNWDTTIGSVKENLSQLGAIIKSFQHTENFARISLSYQGEIPILAETLIRTPGIVIHSIGESSETIKDVGTAINLDIKHKLSQLTGTHGIGHVRMATESLVDISHSHPFWAYPFPDVTVVHNGQLTNYHKLKRKYEDLGHHFQTHNDSELIAVYLASQMQGGESLEDSLRASLEDLDGTFTYLVSTRHGMGYAKDRWSAKPLVTMETEDMVAVASEETALRRIFTNEIDRGEPQENEVMTWSV